MLHSNPGDYAWGQGGLDAVITQVDTLCHPLSCCRQLGLLLFLNDLK